MLGLLCLACAGQHSLWPEDVTFDLTGCEEVLLKVEAVPVAGLFQNVNNYFVAPDSVLVVVHRAGRLGPLVQLADLRTGAILEETLPFGAGPQAALQVSAQFRDGVLYIDDFAQHHLYSIDIADLRTRGVDYHPTLEADYHGWEINNVTALWRGRFAGVNPYCFEDEASGIANPDEERLVFFHRHQRPCQKRRTCDYDTGNVVQGHILPLPAQDRIVFASSTVPLIEFYDGSGRKVKRMRGPHPPFARYANQNGNIAFIGSVPFAYQGPIVKDNMLFLNYIGGFGADGNLCSTIIQMDMVGDIHQVLRAPVFFSSFSVMDDGTIYGTDAHSDTPTLWKLFVN